MPSKVNQRFGKFANVARKVLLGSDVRHVLDDYEMLYAAISYDVFEGHGVDFYRLGEMACDHCPPAL